MSYYLLLFACIFPIPEGSVRKKSLRNTAIVDGMADITRLPVDCILYDSPAH